MLITSYDLSLSSFSPVIVLTGLNNKYVPIKVTTVATAVISKAGTMLLTPSINVDPIRVNIKVNTDALTDNDFINPKDKILLNP